MPPALRWSPCALPHGHTASASAGVSGAPLVHPPVRPPRPHGWRSQYAGFSGGGRAHVQPSGCSLGWSSAYPLHGPEREALLPRAPLSSELQFGVVVFLLPPHGPFPSLPHRTPPLPTSPHPGNVNLPTPPAQGRADPSFGFLALCSPPRALPFLALLPVHACRRHAPDKGKGARDNGWSAQKCVCFILAETQLNGAERGSAGCVDLWG